MFDPVQLRSFLTVARTRSFTRAATELGVQQSTVSQHIRKLEQATGRPLFLRDTHTVLLTADGEAMLGFARALDEIHEQAAGYFAGSDLRGRLRFGVSQDLALTQLPRILRDFRRTHPLVDLELTVELSGTLHKALQDGQLDLVFAKRMAGPGEGQLVWRERLAWLGVPDLRLDPTGPVPLIIYPPPSLTRERALQVLEEQRRPWRAVCTSASLNGLAAAALGGLGVVPFVQRLGPAGLAEVPAQYRLPALGEVEFVLLHTDRVVPESAEALAAAIRTAA
ncbi:LysR family transcriptional regulator [Cryptosporangium phraense]|uniref:LysR family transcriptional regulator n=1 Tax=Cryptosporangium phraense TaxID=2593070 RepID=A0A545AWI0_9ACTN|nr:LysR family transcriptional regulator [Cryptosporangium phraense]TQS45686.1 LysR family transcriptional regulator [Cryptosporangium phraense]